MVTRRICHLCKRIYRAGANVSIHILVPGPEKKIGWAQYISYLKKKNIYLILKQESSIPL